MNIDEYIEISKNREFDTQGGNSKCHIFNKHVLLCGRYNKEGLDETIKKTIDARLLGASISQILEYKIEDGEGKYNNGYMLQEKAKGNPLHKRANSRKINMAKTEEEKCSIRRRNINDNLEELEVLNNAEQQQYEKFIQDWINIRECGLMVDPSKTDNFFYDKENGFTFIDLDPGENENILETNESKELFCNELMVVIINSSLYYSPQMQYEDKKNVEEKVAMIVPKISNSLEKAGISKNIFDEVMQDKYPKIADKYMTEQQKFSMNLTKNVKKEDEIKYTDSQYKHIDKNDKEI